MNKNKDVLAKLKGASRKSGYTKLFDEAAFEIENNRNNINILKRKLDLLIKENNRLNNEAKEEGIFKKIFKYFNKR